MNTALSSSHKLPAHIAIIMDGNGRWAKARHKPRVFGHQEGVKTVRKIVEDASEIGVKCLTLYSFSTENWSRPRAEITALFGLLRKYIRDDLETLHGRGVRVRILGSRENLSSDMLALLDKVEEKTKDNTDFSLNIAFNYGGRDEILRASRCFAQDVKMGKLESGALDEALFAKYLDTDGLPSPDLVIRTSGNTELVIFCCGRPPMRNLYLQMFFGLILHVKICLTRSVFILAENEGLAKLALWKWPDLWGGRLQIKGKTNGLKP